MITILVIILYGNFTNGVLYQQENEHLQLIMHVKQVGLLQDIRWTFNPSIAWQLPRHEHLTIQHYFFSYPVRWQVIILEGV